MKVYPRLTEIREHQLALRKDRLLDIGVHMARLKGAGLEFESLRDYQPGDEMRRLDWKATARHGEPLTREYEVERSQHIVLALDLGRTMASRLGLLTKVDHAVNAAALLAYVAASLGDWVGFYSFVGEPVGFTPPRKYQFTYLLDALDGLQPQTMESDYYRAFVDISHRLRKRALIVLFTDLPDPDSSARLIGYVRVLTRRHLVLCAALSDYELHALSRRVPHDPRALRTHRRDRPCSTTGNAPAPRPARGRRDRGGRHPPESLAQRPQSLLEDQGAVGPIGQTGTGLGKTGRRPRVGRARKNAPCVAPLCWSLVIPRRRWQIPVRFQVGAPHRVGGGGEEFGVADVGDVLGAEGAAAEAQAAFLRGAVALEVIALGAAAHQVAPLARAAAVLGDHVVDGERGGARAAVLADVLVARRWPCARPAARGWAGARDGSSEPPWAW